MQRVILKGLRSKKQLKEIANKEVLCAGFADDEEKNFEITFDCGEGKKIDLLVSFETRSPHIYISDAYKEV